MKEIHRKRYGKEQSFHVPSESTTIPTPQYVHQSGNSPDPVIWGFLWRFYDIGIIDQIISHQ